MAGALDHVGIFVDDLDSAIPFYSALLGGDSPVVRAVPELGLRLAFFTRQGGLPLELVESRGRTELAHGDVVVALEVDDLAAEIDRLRAAGIRCHHQKPTENLPLERGWIAKGDARGTVIELCPKGEVARFAAV
ncbi:MAG: VOC family protein [Rhodobacteraceae bacterium]|nr:VOC family protein [Paracoccaceae bacterium]